MLWQNKAGSVDWVVCTALLVQRSESPDGQVEQEPATRPCGEEQFRTTSWAASMKTQAAGWGPLFHFSIWDLWAAPGALCLVLGSLVTWNVPIYSSGDCYFGLYTWSISTERASHSWGWASAHITEGSKHLVIFNGKVVLQIPVSLFDDHIHAKECLRQPLGRDKVCVCRLCRRRG